MRQPPENVFVERLCISDVKLSPLKMKNAVKSLAYVLHPSRNERIWLTARIEAARDSAEYASICSSLL